MFFRAVVLNLLLAVLAVARASECVPHDSERMAKPYRGYSNTGWRGAPVKDMIWFKKVREFKYKDGSIEYAFRRNPQDKYESIATIRTAEDHPLAFVAHRDGCEALFDLQGKRLPVPLFTSIDEYKQRTPAVSRFGPGALRLKLFEPLTSDENGWRYVVLTSGGVAARSPHTYEEWTTGYASTLPAVLEPYEEVRVEGGGRGIVREDTLDEVVAPQWRQVGQVVVRTGDGDRHKTYLVAMDASRIHVFDEGGRPLELSGEFDRVSVRSQALDAGAGRYVDLISFASTARKVCRLLSPDLLPILDQEIPLPDGFSVQSRYSWHDSCPLPSNDAPGFIAVQDDGTNIKIFSRDSALHFRLVGEVKGVLINMFQNGRILVESGGSSRNYMLYEPSGEAALSNGFQAVDKLGCGFVKVRQDGT